MDCSVGASLTATVVAAKKHENLNGCPFRAWSYSYVVGSALPSSFASLTKTLVLQNEWARLVPPADRRYGRYIQQSLKVGLHAIIGVLASAPALADTVDVTFVKAHGDVPAGTSFAIVEMASGISQRLCESVARAYWVALDTSEVRGRVSVRCVVGSKLPDAAPRQALIGIDAQGKESLVGYAKPSMCASVATALTYATRTVQKYNGSAYCRAVQ